jgi:type II secretory ATPase GspE/PulE/Tfp pilus assembly ATPase PilB-like protein
MSSLQLCSSDGRGYVLPLGQTPLTIGRNADNALPLTSDEAASRYHCVIEPDGQGGHTIRDLASRNGTKVNAARIQGVVPLKAGDSLKVGTHTFSVESMQSIGEVRREVRSRTIDTDKAWAAELRGMVDSLAPRGEMTDEAVQMVDSRGNPTGALKGDGDGQVSVRYLLLLAAKARATDLHVEPKPDRYTVRMRVDGQMVAIADLPVKAGELTGGLVRAACNMVIAGKDAVQDGHFSVRMRTRRVDYRVSFTPSMHGQKLVLRVLDASNAPRSLTDLGLPGYMLQRVKKTCEKDNGLLLVCGPTGSGKTTTLYNALREIDRETTNVVTIEDPVEYQLEGVTQIPVDEAKGNTFGGLLRSVLRQDPDVILVGEIRDEETARVAMQAAITGHVVFSTVHAKDTITAVFRLLDLKVEPYLVANSLDVVLAQRLVRVLCDNCKRAHRITPGMASRLGKWLEGKNETYDAVGCGACLKTGYRGRRALFEMLDFNDELRDVVLRDPSIGAMRKTIEKGLFTTLLQSAWQLAARGVTSLEEAERTAGQG